MNKPSFLSSEKPLITAMIQCRTLEECKAKIKESLKDGAEAFGIQLCQLERQYRTKEILTDIFKCCENKPIYITSYRYNKSTGMTDEECASLLLLGLECGATLCDIMGDLYDRNEKQITYDETATGKQKELADRIHSFGGEVLISTHDFRPLSADEIFKVAKAQAKRGADIIKIVVNDDNISFLPEYMGVIQKIRKETGKKVLFLSIGRCGKILRRIGGAIGCCMYLCVSSHNEFDTKEQPLIKEIISIRKGIEE